MATEPASLIPLMKGVRDDHLDCAWPFYEFPALVDSPNMWS